MFGVWFGVWFGGLNHVKLVTGLLMMHKAFYGGNSVYNVLVKNEIKW
jgi:hypothetical protein